MNQCLAGFPGRPLVEAEHEGRTALPLATHRTRHRVLSRAVTLDGLHVIGQLDLIILTRLIGRSHTLAVQRAPDGSESQGQHHKRTTLDSGEYAPVFLHHVASWAKRGKSPPRQPTVWGTHSQCSLKLDRSL